jgi:hypothetical protein
MLPELVIVHPAGTFEEVVNPGGRIVLTFAF